MGKRRNGGRNKKNRGHTMILRCTNCGRAVPKDKAIKRYTVRNMVDASSLRDIKDNRAIEDFSIPKLFYKLQYCVSCAIHHRTVRVRKVDIRRSRDPPRRRPIREERRQ